jgi:hypothetical protein
MATITNNYSQTLSNDDNAVAAVIAHCDRLVKSTETAQFVSTSPPSDVTYNIDRSMCVGATKTMGRIMEQLALRNSANNIEHVDYNRYGQLGFQLTPISKHFCDNLCIGIPLEPYMLVKTKSHTSNVFCGDYRKALYRNLLSTGFTNLNAGCIKAISIKSTANRPDIKTQVYNVACADTPIKTVLTALPKLIKLGYIFYDIDFTLDYQGSFDRATLQTHLISNCGFVCQGYATAETWDRPTIVRPSCGNNCLTYMDTYKDNTIRNKVYNKFAQCLESGSVRSTVGTHMWHWVKNPEKRLQASIRKTLDAGFTRTEVTFYNRIPDMGDIETVLSRWSNTFLPKRITYKTPISKQWESFINALKRNLVIYCPSSGEVLLAHWINGATGKIGGFSKTVNDPKHLGWILAEMTLCLPTDVFYLDWNQAVDKLYCGIRSFHKQSSSLDTRTRMIEGCYIYKSGTSSSNHGMPLINGVGFTMFSKSASKSSAYRYNMVEVSVPFKPNLLSTRYIEKALVSEQRLQEHLAQLRETAKRYAALDVERDAKVELEVRSAIAFNKIKDNLTVSTRRKFGQHDVGSSFDIIGITEYNGGRYGTQYLLATETTAYYSDPYSRRILPDKLESLRKTNVIVSHKHKGLTIWMHRNRTTIYTVHVTRWATTQQRNPYAYTSHTWTSPNPVDQMQSQSMLVEELERDVGNMKTLQRFEYEGVLTNAIKLETMEVLVAIPVYSIATTTHRSNEVTLYRSLDGTKVYRSNYYSQRKQVATIRKNKPFLIIPLRKTRTPNGNYEMDVTISTI